MILLRRYNITVPNTPIDAKNKTTNETVEEVPEPTGGYTRTKSTGLTHSPKYF